MKINSILIFLFLMYLFFVPIDLSRLFGEQFGIIQTLIKGSLTISIIILFFITLKNDHTIKKYTNLPWHYSIFMLPWIYVSVAIISISWTNDFPQTIKSILAIVSVIFLAELVSKRIELNYLLLKSLLIIDIIIILSLLSDIVGLSFARMEFVDAIRYAGITYGAHAIGRVAFLGFLFRLYFISKKQYNKKQLIIAIFMMLAYIYSIHIANSRQILLALIAITPIWLLLLNSYLFTKYKKLNYILIFFFAILVLLYGLNSYQGNVLDIFQRTGKEDIFTFTGRVFVWESALKLIQEQPFIGYGYGAGGSVLYYFHGLTSEWSTHSAHNIFIHQLLDLGILGLILLVSMLLYFLKQSLKIKNKIFISYLLFIIVVGFLERSLSGPPSLMYLYFILFFFYIKQHKFHNKDIS